MTVRVGVTGASGFVGGHVVRHLAARDDLELVALTRTLASRSPPQNVRWIQGDLASAVDCARFVDGVDAVLHLAHVNAPLTSNRDLPADASANLVATVTLLQAIRDQGRPIHVVYASSGGAIYKPSPTGVPLTEDSPLEPLTSYGITKVASESYLRLAAAEGWASSTALRIGNAYGGVLPRERLQGFIGVAIHEIAAGRPVRIFGDPENVRDYVHLRDIAHAFELALAGRPGASVYNIGSGVGTSVQQLVRLLESLAGDALTVEEDVSERAEAAHLPSWAVLDSTRAQEELGWRPEIGLEDGVRELWESVL